MHDESSLILEFARAEQVDDPFAFRFAAQTYLLRREGGGFESSRFGWDDALLGQLHAVHQPGCDPALPAQLGEKLRHFLAPLGGAEYEARILAAVRTRRRLVVTIRSAAAELYALPWELLTLKSTGQHLGELPGVLLRYEWPETETLPGPPVPPLSGRILFCASAAGGAVPVSEQLQAITTACAAAFLPFDRERDVLTSASARRLVARLEEAAREGRPFSVLHLLCRVRTTGSAPTLVLDGESPTEEAAVVDAERLRQLLAPLFSTLRLVVLSAGGSTGHGPGTTSALGSIAQTLHRAGLAAAVAARYPLSLAGSVRLTQVLYSRLLGGPESLESAFLAARAALLTEAAQGDWASVQLYSRAADGDDTRPIPLRPYRGLLSFGREHQRFFFGRDAEIAEVLSDLAALQASGRPRVLVVAGASGTGKSSLVLAGVLPKLLASNPSLRVATLRPGADPLAALERALASVEGGGAAGPTLVVVDQLEELFTHTEAQDRRDAFMARLWQLASEPAASKSATSFILTLRVDFIGRVGEIKLDATGLRLDSVAYDEAHRVFVSQMGPAALAAAIEEPARAVGLALSDGLVARMVGEVGGEPGALPLLEDALDLLWQRRSGRTLTQGAYDELGGVAGALHKRADAIVDALPAAEQRTARRMLVRLVSIADDIALSTRRRVPVARLRPADPAGRERFDHVLARLVEARLLVVAAEGGAASELVEVAHEALIRRWSRLGEWVKSDRQMLADLEKIDTWVRQRLDVKTLLIESQIGYVKLVAESYPEDFPEDARRLLRDSEEFLRRRKRLRLWTVRLIVLAAIAFALLGWYGMYKANEAQVEAGLARDGARMGALRALADEPGVQAGLLREFENEDLTQARGWLPAAVAVLRATAEPVSSVKTGVAHGAGLVTASADCSTVAALDDKQGIRIWKGGQLIGQVPLKRAVRGASATLSPDGSRLLVTGPGGSGPAEILASERASAAPVTLPGSALATRMARFSPDGKHVVVVSTDQVARVFGSEGGEVNVTLGGQHGSKHGSGMGVDFSPDGRLVALASGDRMVRVYSRDGAEVASLLTRSRPYGFLFSRDGSTLLVNYGASVLDRFPVPGAGVLPELQPAAPAQDPGLGFAGDGTWDAALPVNRGVRLWGKSSTRQIILAGNREQLHGVLVCPNGRQLLTLSAGGTATTWRLPESPLAVGLFELPRQRATLARFSPDGKRFAVGYQSGDVELWNSDGTGRPVVLHAHHSPITSLAFSADGRQLLSASVEPLAQISRTDGSGEPVLLMGSGRLVGADMSPDGTRVATLMDDHKLRIWSAEAGEELRQVDAKEELSGLRFSPDGRFVGAISVMHGTVRLFATDGKAPELQLPLGMGTWGKFAFTGDGRIATTSYSDVTTVYRLDGLAPPLILRKPEHGYALDFTRDGKRLAIGYSSVVVWSADGSGQPTEHTTQSYGPVREVVWSADGSRLLACSWDFDSSVRIYPDEGRGPPFDLIGQDADCKHAALSPDGKVAISIGKQQTAWVWNVDSAQMMRTADLQRRLWDLVDECPTGSLIESYLNRRPLVRFWDQDSCKQMVACLNRAPASAAQKGDPYSGCLATFRDRQRSWRRSNPFLKPLEGLIAAPAE